MMGSGLFGASEERIGARYCLRVSCCAANAFASAERGWRLRKSAVLARVRVKEAGAPRAGILGGRDNGFSRLAQTGSPTGRHARRQVAWG